MVMRVSGLASGMDIDDIVSKLMTAQRVPLDKLYQKKTYTEWQRDDYRTINTALSELDRLISDGIGRQASFIKKTVSVSNPNAVSIKNVNSTTDFSGTIEVKELATAATMVSTEKVMDVTNATKFAGQTITIKAINKDGTFDKVKDKDGNIVDKVFTYEVKSDDTLDSIISKINAESGVTAFFDEKSGRFSITAKNTGKAVSEHEIALSSSGDFFTKLKMSATSTEAATADLKNDSGIVVGKAGTVGENAEVVYNGLTIERSSNTFRINGAEFTLKEKTTGPVTFSSTADVDTIFDTVKKFVDSYNGLIATISSKTSEKKNSSYPPLTDEQKKEMTEDQVKKWEEQARKGTLRRDSTLTSLLTKMRTSLYTQVGGTSLGTLDKIGITTTKNYLEGGKLEIDEEKLKAAIAEDPNAIYELFMQDGDPKEGKQGIARRLREELSAGMKTISEKAGSASSVNSSFTLGKLLNEYDKKIDSFNDRLTALETRYYKQFTAMETAINKANSQSASLSSYFSS
ncbi:flagellar hook-associated protein 2 [Peribacillus asahii]|uniref:flagellar hook-associated protein 2 n=1 Tax=Peribacillus asahii TaxID=228899 RepID=UPI00207A57F1|nr:flagellar hook-associated protein 2 [Peribacillus asahii]USK84857.1 flagellar hook-associated protein 2 [Peribacillus asahii]